MYVYVVKDLDCCKFGRQTQNQAEPLRRVNHSCTQLDVCRGKAWGRRMMQFLWCAKLAIKYTLRYVCVNNSQSILYKHIKSNSVYAYLNC